MFERCGDDQGRLGTDLNARPRDLCEHLHHHTLNQIDGIGDAPEAEQRSKASAAVAAYKHGLTINLAANTATWVRQANAAQFAEDQPANAINDYITKSYTASRFVTATAPIRVALVLAYWDAMSEGNRSAAALETKAICKAVQDTCQDIKALVAANQRPEVRDRFASWLPPPPAKA